MARLSPSHFFCLNDKHISHSSKYSLFNGVWSMTAFLLILIGAIAVAAVTAMFWAISNKTKNLSVVKYILPVSMIVYCGVFFFGTHGLQGKEFLALATVLIWGLRMSFQIFIENKAPLAVGAPPAEPAFDIEPKKVLISLQKKSLLNLFLAVPFFLISLGTVNKAGSFDLLAFTLAYLSIFGATVADYQYRYFYSIPFNHGKSCNEGLWAFSKHPNYLFELLVWIGFAFLAVGAPYGVFAFVAPLARFYMLAIQDFPNGQSVSTAIRIQALAFFERPHKK